jgi:hypothetical protein
MIEVKEKLFGWNIKWNLNRFYDPTGVIAEKLQHGLSMTEAMREYKDSFLGSDQWEKNLALNEGLGEIIDLICGLGSPTKWDNSHAYIGVGDSDTAVSATQTGLQAATNKTFKPMDTGYPQRTGQTAEWRATFGSNDANYAWKEYTVVNASTDDGKNLNRKVQDKGTKELGETWTLDIQLTLN